MSDCKHGSIPSHCPYCQNTKLQAVVEAYEQKFLHNRSDLRDAGYRNNKLKAENDGLRGMLYTEGWSDAVIDRVIKEMERE